MKKKIIAAAAAAMIAVSSLSSVAYAEEDTSLIMDMDNPFSGCYEKQDDGTWKITDRCLRLMNMALDEDDAEFYFHLTFSKKLDNAMIVFRFFEGDKEYSYTEDMMKLDGRTEIYLPVSHIAQCINDNTEGGNVDFHKIDYGTMDPGVLADKLTDVEITAKDGSEDSEYSIFQSGVWAVYNTDKDGNYKPEDFWGYYIFNDETSGRTVIEKSGLPFGCEQKGKNITFHMGGADDTTEAVFDQREDGSLYGTIDYDGEQRTYRFVKVRFADPETFDPDAPLFRGVWGLYFDEGAEVYGDGALGYLIVHDKDNAVLATSDHIKVTDAELDQTFSMFNMSYTGTDENDKFSLKYDADGDFIFEQEGMELRFSYDAGLDPDTFELADESELYREWMLPDPAAQLMDASGTAGGNVGLTINYVFPLDKGFDVSFKFKTSDGKKKTYRINSDKALNTDTIYIRVRDLLEAAGVKADDVTELTIRNNMDTDIVWIDFTTGSHEYAEIVPKGVVHPAEVSGETETNPATGVDGMAALAAVSGISALAALLSRKRK